MMIITTIDSVQRLSFFLSFCLYLQYNINDNDERPSPADRGACLVNEANSL